MNFLKSSFEINTHIIFTVVIFLCFQLDSFGQREHVASDDLSYHIYDAGFLDSYDGKIVPILTGGFPPYTFDWSGPDDFHSADSLLTNVCPGIYTLKVNDALCGKISADIEIESVENKFVEFSDLKIAGVSPNPFYNDFAINLESNEDQTCIVKLLDSTSRVVYQSSKRVTRGQNKIMVNELDIDSGIYIVQICIVGKCLLSDIVVKID